MVTFTRSHDYKEGPRTVKILFKFRRSNHRSRPPYVVHIKIQKPNGLYVIARNRSILQVHSLAQMFEKQGNNEVPGLLKSLLVIMQANPEEALELIDLIRAQYVIRPQWSLFYDSGRN